MPKGYRPYLPEQELLLPPSLREWVAEEHLVYFVSDVVDKLDLSAIHAVYGEEKRRQPPYDPRLTTKLLVYGYCTSVQFAPYPETVAGRHPVQGIGGGQRAGYNAQAAVEPERLLIVAPSVTEATNDKQQLEPMVEAIEQQSGQQPEAISVDSVWLISATGASPGYPRL